MNQDFAQGGVIEDANTVAHRLYFAGNALFFGVAGLPEIGSARPAAVVFHAGACLTLQLVGRQLTHRPVKRTHMARPEERSVGRAGVIKWRYALCPNPKK